MGRTIRIEVRTMSVVLITPIGDPSGTSEIAVQWQLMQDSRDLAANQAAEASRQTLALSQAKVDSDEVLASAVAAQQVQVKQQARAGLDVQALQQAQVKQQTLAGLDSQALQQAQVKEQILASQDIHASLEILVTQVVRATQDVQPNPQVEHGQEVAAIQQSSGAATAATDSRRPVDVRL
jgi:hypothetical protein